MNLWRHLFVISVALAAALCMVVGLSSPPEAKP
jgi:hypothetical protein